jgi:hypothetical protein
MEQMALAQVTIQIRKTILWGINKNPSVPLINLVALKA